HHQLREAGADRHVGSEQAEVAEGKADEPGDGEPAPGARRGVEGKRHAAQRPRRQAEEAEGDDEADEVEAEGADAARRGVESESGEGPGPGGAESGELAGMSESGHGSEA